MQHSRFARLNIEKEGVNVITIKFGLEYAEKSLCLGSYQVCVKTTEESSWFLGLSSFWLNIFQISVKT